MKRNKIKIYINRAVDGSVSIQLINNTIYYTVSVYTDGDIIFYSKDKNSKRHCVYGYAFYTYNEPPEYWINGKRCNKAEFFLEKTKFLIME